MQTLDTFVDTKGKKIEKPSPTKPTPTTTTQKAKKQTKEKKKATEQPGLVQKKSRRKYIAYLQNDDEERTKSDDNIQFRVESHAPKSNIDNICENIRDNADLTGLKTIELNKLNREDQNKIEESVYAMMAKFKNNPLEFDTTMPKDLCSVVENKWHYFLNMEKEIRESALTQVMLELSKG